ncbi:cytochrome P450 [Micromonospora sp. ALFpr18c]|uniref:cytochrome P450 n=1 Tax=unclassified Micromonospora TaxID=2617518 RepID=UPI00124B5308|nr:cytochrome P450 [Micromonospora sp. ALFpr18c]KAB1933413.1 cytochrome P450 [Micromonospora sp. ALFpr18c]
MPDGLTWDDGLESWVVSDRALVRHVLGHPDSFSSRTSVRLGELYMTDQSRAEYQALTEFIQLWFVHTDGDEHTARRKPVQRMFSLAAVRSLEERVVAIVDECLDDLAAQQAPDFIPTVAEGVSGRVMAHVVGIDIEPGVLHTWSRHLSAFLAAMYRRDHAEKATDVMREMLACLTGSALWSRFPTDTPRERAVTAATLSMILFGGLETTAALLGSCVHTALGDAATWAMLKDAAEHDDPRVTARFVESILATRPPLRNVARVVTKDMTLAGAQLSAGDLMFVPLADGITVFTESSATDAVAEDDTSGANGDGERTGPHLAFGLGAHYCVGASLVRLEAATVLRRLATRFPDARLAAIPAVWGPNISYIGLDHLPLELDTRKAVG